MPTSIPKSQRTTGPFEAVAVDHIELNSEGKIIRFLPYVAANRVAKTVELQKKVKAAG